MKRNKIIAFSFIITCNLFFQSCEKDNINIKDEIPVVEAKELKMEAKTYQSLVDAHNVIAEFLLQSKATLDKHPTEFNEICKNGDTEELLHLIGYSQEEANEMGLILMNCMNLISLEFQGMEPPAGGEYCETCNLENFPETLYKLNYGASSGGPDWDSVAICLWECGIGCSYLWALPGFYVACMTVCTGACYYLSTSAVVAPCYNYYYY